MSARGGGRGDAQESWRFLLSFSGSELSRHLHRIEFERAEAMEELLYILYDRVDGRISIPNLARIFIVLGGDSGGGGGRLVVA